MTDRRRTGRLGKADGNGAGDVTSGQGRRPRTRAADETHRVSVRKNVR